MTSVTNCVQQRSKRVQKITGHPPPPQILMILLDRNLNKSTVPTSMTTLQKLLRRRTTPRGKWAGQFDHSIYIQPSRCVTLLYPGCLLQGCPMFHCAGHTGIYRALISSSHRAPQPNSTESLHPPRHSVTAAR